MVNTLTTRALVVGDIIRFMSFITGRFETTKNKVNDELFVTKAIIQSKNFIFCVLILV